MRGSTRGLMTYGKRGVAGLVAGLFTVAWTTGCVSTRVGDLEAFVDIPMNRVVPYPDRAEMRKRAFEVVIEDATGDGLDLDVLGDSQAQARDSLEAIAQEAGALLLGSPVEIPSELDAEEVGWGEEDEGPGDQALIEEVDLVISTRFERVRITPSWKPPFKFVWQTPEEVAEKPGTCTHLAEVRFGVAIYEAQGPAVPLRSFVLDHAAKRVAKDLDQSCPLTPAARSVLFETAMSEAFGCLRLPLGRLLAPRGHVTGHRKAPHGGERHLFRITLGSAQGIEPGDEIAIRREQRTETPEGVARRTERTLVTGTVTDRVSGQASWVALDPTSASEEILRGDVARPVLREGLVASLSGPNCGRILLAE